ncbi:MAG: metal ABC transporter substrate-binding protein [Acidimicrobiia bacterium]|nr:metal ABC transporter substrate-binding protein [Acidimicrobiia bacterium]
MTLAALALIATACGTDGTGGTQQSGPLIVVTTTILGNVVDNLVDGAARVEIIMPVGADPHDFQASAQQAELIREADLLVANGLGLEEGLLDVIEAAEADGATVLELAPLLDPLPSAEYRQNEGEEHRGGEDPHFWQDPVRMAQAVQIITGRLAQLDSGVSAEEWTERAESYAAQIMVAHAENEATLSAIPVERRKMVTNHDAFGYFADRYNFELIGVVIPGGSTLAEPSAGEIAELVGEMKRQDVRAIFAENTDPSVLAEAVAAELGDAVVVVRLFTDSLGEPGSPADTYIGMIKENATLVAGALA